MTPVDPSNFEVISRDRHGDPVHCSYCARGVPSVVVLPLTRRPELDERIAEADGADLWVGLCAYCVLAMAQSLALASKHAQEQTA